MNTRYLGIDLGTSSVKVMLIDDSASPVDQADAHYRVRAPHPGHSEANPRDWWRTVVAAVRQLPERDRGQVLAVGLSGQMHGFVLSDAAGTPVRPAILWSDTRSARQLERYRALDTDTRRKLGNPVVTGMAGPGLLWLQESEPDSLRDARRVLQPKDWLRLRLTGRTFSEHSDASATLLYDVESGGWFHELCRDFGLDAELLPELLESGDTAGTLLPGAAAELGLPVSIPVIAGAGDTAAAALGNGLVTPGAAQLTLGTGAQIVVIGEKAVLHQEQEPVINLFRAATAGHWYRMAAMQNAGLALEWVRRILNLDWPDLYGSLDRNRLDPELLFLPWLSGERTPLLNPFARASWRGLHQGHTTEDMAAAALVGVALSIRAGLQALHGAGAKPELLRVAGGGSRNGTFVRLVADLLQTPLAVSDSPAASALGAALLARGAPVPDRAIPITHHPRELPDHLLHMIEMFEAQSLRHQA